MARTRPPNNLKHLHPSNYIISNAPTPTQGIFALISCSFSRSKICWLLCLSFMRIQVNNSDQEQTAKHKAESSTSSQCVLQGQVPAQSLAHVTRVPLTSHCTLLLKHNFSKPCFCFFEAFILFALLLQKKSRQSWPGRDRQTQGSVSNTFIRRTTSWPGNNGEKQGRVVVIVDCSWWLSCR